MVVFMILTIILCVLLVSIGLTIFFKVNSSVNKLYEELNILDSLIKYEDNNFYLQQYVDRRCNVIDRLERIIG